MCSESGALDGFLKCSMELKLVFSSYEMLQTFHNVKA